MTVHADVEKVHLALCDALGHPAAAEEWMDTAQERWDGRCAFDLIEHGRTDEVMDAVADERLRF